MCLASRLEGPIRLRVYVKALSLCWPSHLDSGFLSSADLVTAFRLVFVLLRGISLDWTIIKERLPQGGMAYLTLSLSRWPLFLPFVAHICMLCQYHEFSSSSISPAVRSTQGLEHFPLCGLLSSSAWLKDECAPVSWKYLKPQKKFRLLDTKAKSLVGVRTSAVFSYLVAPPSLCLQSSSVP